eukprot:243347-Prorocentrum_minimum.AAC.5
MGGGQEGGGRGPVAVRRGPAGGDQEKTKEGRHLRNGHQTVQNLAVTGGCGTTRARNLKHVSGDALPATGLDTDMYAVCKELAGESNPLESDKAA